MAHSAQRNPLQSGVGRRGKMRPMDRRPSPGFTLVEVLLAVAIVAVLTFVAAPSYSSYVERTRVNQAIIDIVAISAQIKAFELDNRDVPDNLSQIGAAYGDLLEAVDLNPVAVLPAGRGVLVLDALVIPRKPTSQGSP